MDIVVSQMVAAIVAGLVGGFVTGVVSIITIRVELRYMRRDINLAHKRLSRLDGQGDLDDGELHAAG